MGFTPHTVTSPAAWWSSLAVAARFLRGSRTVEEIDRRVAGTDTWCHMVDTFALLARHGAQPSKKEHRRAIPPRLGDFFSFYGNEKIPVIPGLYASATSPSP